MMSPDGYSNAQNASPSTPDGFSFALNQINLAENGIPLAKNGITAAKDGFSYSQTGFSNVQEEWIEGKNPDISQQVSVSLLVDSIEDAKIRIAEKIVRTPTIRLPWLDTPHRQVWAKLECHQHSGSFKYRGAINALTKTSFKRIITASAGNHALATAAAGSRLGKSVHIIAPTTASEIKLRRLIGDANVTLLGQDLFEATKEAMAISHASANDSDGGIHYLSPYADLDVAAGAGTLAIEAFEDIGNFDHVVLPLGGGGLAAAVGSWCSLKAPSTKVTCTHPEVFGRTFDLEHPISQQLNEATSPTYSDGLAVQIIEKTLFADVLDSTIHSVVQVSESDTAAAISHALRLQSLLIEGSAATTIAALISKSLTTPLQGRILLLLTGGNISSSAVAKSLVTSVANPKLRQDLGLRHIISSVERHGSVYFKLNEQSRVLNNQILVQEMWMTMCSRLEDSVNSLKEKFDRKQILGHQLKLQTDDWTVSFFCSFHQKLRGLCHEFFEELQTQNKTVTKNWVLEERFRVLLQLYATLSVLFDRASSSTDQSNRDWFFDPEAQHASNCNYDRYGSPELRKIEQRFIMTLELCDQKPVELLLTSSGMAAYQVIQHYLLQQLGAHGVIVLSPYIYFEALEQLEALKHISLIHASSFHADDIIKTAERNSADVVFLDPIANTVELSVTDIRYFARTVSTRPGWSDRVVILDGTMESGGMNVFDWFEGPHSPTVLYYESASKYLQLGLDLQMGGLLVYPSRLDNIMRTIRRNTGAIMYSRNAATLPPIDRSIHQTRMLQLTLNAEQLCLSLIPRVSSIAEVRFPHEWRDFGWRHGGAVVTVRFLRDGMNNKEGLEACTELILRAAEALEVPMTKGVSFGFSTTRLSSASSMAKDMDPFLRFSVGMDIENMKLLADSIIAGVQDYDAIFGNDI